MELLQKLTLYDLFGYTLPGVIALLLYGGGDILYWAGDITLGGLGLLVVLGYMAGVMITEIAECIEWLLRKMLSDGIKKNYWEELCKIYGITAKKVNYALRQAKVTEDDLGDCAGLTAEKYMTYMYSEIQTDPQYSRMHNYASAELLYKNMAVVAVYAVAMGVVQQHAAEIVAGAIGTVLFLRRRIRFAERSKGYVICWFVQKYGK